jgi:long-chain acyl-CoA synthetase
VTAYKTIPEMFFQRVAESGSETSVIHKQDGSWIPRTWNQLESEVRETARGISDWVDAKDIVCLLAENRPEWWIADLAILSLGAASAPIYATNPPKDIAYILNDCGAKLLFVSTVDQLNKIRGLKKEGKIEGLQRVVVMDPVQASEDWVLTLDEVRKRNSGAADPIAERMKALTEEDLATLIYTSGTTGEPKGVMLTHRNLVSNAKGGSVVFDRIQLDEKLMLSFLPLSHSFERLVGYYAAIAFNCKVAFAEGVPQLVDNMGEVRPTLLVSVPRIYEKLYGRVMQNAASGFKRKLVLWALKVGKQRAGFVLANQPIPFFVGLKYAIAFKLVFSKLHVKLGGRLKYAISGGAPLAPAIADFLNAVSLTVFEGYGLSETSPILTANTPGKIKVGSVGQVWPGVEVKIEPDPEREGKDGEILVKGPNIMKGYYNKPEATAEVFDDEGWFRTGDIGYVDDDGFLFITDRKKELLKTAGGKYVAPQPIENNLKVHPLVEQAVVIGDKRKYCVALIVPSFEGLEATLTKPLPSDRSELNNDPQVRSLIQEAVDEVNRDLGSWEQIKRFHLLAAEMTQETGELTPSLKVKRRIVDEKYKPLIDAMYPPD